MNTSPYIRTQCRVRQNDGTYQLVDVLASVRVAGYTFLIHASITYPAKWSATYTPIGIGVIDYDSIAELIAALDRNADEMKSVIGRALKTMAETETPTLAPECGIITEEDWKYREAQRFINGEYRALPSIGAREYPKEHYAHLSVTKTESDFVAYTPSESYGQLDRQVRLKFGKYLKKAFADITDAEVQAAVISLRAQSRSGYRQIVQRERSGETCGGGECYGVGGECAGAGTDAAAEGKLSNELATASWRC